MRYLSSTMSRRRAQSSENALKMQSALRFLSETELADLVGDDRVVSFLAGEENLPDDRKRTLQFIEKVARQFRNKRYFKVYLEGLIKCNVVYGDRPPHLPYGFPEGKFFEKTLLLNAMIGLYPEDLTSRTGL